MKTLPESIPPSLMAIGAHADDIEIGVGGTLEKAFRNGYWKAVDRGYRGGLIFWMEPQTRFGPAYHRWETFVDYSPYVDRKMELIGKHACQMPNAHLPTFGHRILSQEYGKASGCLAAECFIWGRRPDLREGAESFPAYGSISVELLQNGR